MFSSSTEPIVADDWLRRTARDLTTAGCTDAERVRFATHQLDGPAAAWWENYMLGNVVISKKFLRTPKIMVMHRNERG